MATILAKKYTESDSLTDITAAILKLATDKHGRVLLAVEEEWKGTKLKEIARLTRIVRRKIKP
jgi:hypothetical protein